MLLRHVRGYSQTETEIIRCSIHDFPLMEKRPLDVSMKPDKLLKATKIQLHDIDDVCKSIVNDYFKNE